jgi:hypothetical protein|nr:MAG TPA: tail tape measure [Caudoviricetes sp.]
MAESIRGLTVEISADASSFNKEMSQMRKAAQSSQSELAALQKSLDLEFDASKLERAQKVAQDAIDQTAANADVLRRRLEYLEETGNVDTSAYRKLQTELAQTELKGQQLQKQLEKLDTLKFDKLSSQITGIGDKITGAGRALAPFSAAAVAAVTATGALGVSAASAGAEIDDLALRLGISAEKVQEYQYVTAQCGVEWSVFEKALIKARAAIVDLSAGTINNASKALQSLGLRIEDFDSKEAMFDGIIDALAGMEDKTLQTAYANEIFGDKIANQMLPFLNAGADAINQFKSEFETIAPLSNEQVTALATLDDTLYLVKQSIKNVGLQLGASFAPLIKSVADSIQNNLIPKLQKLAAWFNSLSLSQQQFAVKALLVVAALAPLTLGVGKLVGAVGNIIKVIPQLMSGLSALAAHPIILIIAAVAAILIILYTQCEAFREAINNLLSMISGALQPVLDVIIGLLQSVMDLLSPILEIVGGILGTIINLVVTALQPFFDMLTMIFNLLTPLLNVALIPLKVVLTALQVPLQILGQLLGWLSPLFQVFGNIVSKIFGGVVKIINIVLGVIEDAVNFVIGIINGLIDGVNAALGWLGVHIDRIADVKLRIDTSDIESMDDVNAIIDSTPPDTSGAGGGTVYDGGNGTGTYGDTYNYDNSTTNKTQNVTVTIANYAAEVDTDALVKKINIKLAEAM